MVISMLSFIDILAMKLPSASEYMINIASFFKPTLNFRSNVGSVDGTTLCAARLINNYSMIFTLSPQIQCKITLLG